MSQVASHLLQLGHVMHARGDLCTHPGSNPVRAASSTPRSPLPPVLPAMTATTDLIPRTIRKRKFTQAHAGPSRITAPVHSNPPTKQVERSEEDSDLITSLITCTITECSISEDFKIRLRTPQGCKSIATFSAKAYQVNASHRDQLLATAAMHKRALSTGIHRYGSLEIP